MKINRLALTAALLCSTAVVSAHADAFNRVASFPVNHNLPEGTDPVTETSSEIIAASEDGTMLVYSDSPLGAIGLIDIADPANPKAGGAVMMDGEPTSLVVAGGKAYVAINTSESYTKPSGILKIVDLATKDVSESCDLGGQPDSAAMAPDGSFLAIAIENERDEDLDDGKIPQLPAGSVAIMPMKDGAPDCDAIVMADLTGIAAIAPTDPEPEFVDINSKGEIVVTLQENNHIAVLAADGTVVSHFSAGEVSLQDIDTSEEGAINFTSSDTVKREPDAVKWITDDLLATANEGDYEGGSRGFTVFDKTGKVVFESGTSFEYAVAAAGHYPEDRSGNKGVEPEGLAFGTYGDTPTLFVLSERGSLVGVYDMTDPAAPKLTQLLPSGIGPEGAVAIPSRNLFVTANETDLGEDGGPRSHVMVYALETGATPAYPTIVSASTEGVPMGWGALSGLVADENEPGTLYAVSDSFYGAMPQIFVIDATKTPAEITSTITVTREGSWAQKLDLEGIANDGKGGFWLASEGRSDRLIPHALYNVSRTGEIEAEIAFPPELQAVQKRFGSEGVTRIGDTLWIAIQREWADDEKGTVKLVSYDPKSKEWGAVLYPLETPKKGWMGLSEITAHGDYVYIVERDNQIGANADVKALYRVPVSEMKPAPLGGDLPTVTKELVRDFIPDLKGFNGYVVDKVEGFAIDADGVGYVVTDNDGVDDSSGETFFWSIGKVE